MPGDCERSIGPAPLIADSASKRQVFGPTH